MTKIVPVSAATFMHIVGVVEIIAGLVVLSRWTKVGSYLVMFWLLESLSTCSPPACFMTLLCEM